MPQKSEEWHKARLGVISASSVKDIMLKTSRKSFVTKMLAEMITGERDAFVANEYMQWGIDHEDEARKAYEEKTGNKVEEVGFVYMDENKRVGCSPDGLVGKAGLIEIKCPMSKTHIGYMIEGPPYPYIMQMQLQMMVTNRIWCDFITYDPRLPESMRLHIVRVDRDPDTINKLLCSCNATIKDIDSFLKDYDIVWSKE